MTKPTINEDLEALRLPELQAKFAEVTGKESKSPNKKFLIRKITEAMATPAGDEKPEAPGADTEPETTTETRATGEADEGEVKLSKLEIPALQAMYREIVGRETKSENLRYLVWRVRQAQKGRVPVGPRSRGETTEHKVLPVRVPASAVAGLDESWKRLGLKNRTEFFRRAVHAYLEGAGENDTAALFAPEA
jgi:hypothetical protein